MKAGHITIRRLKGLAKTLHKVADNKVREDERPRNKDSLYNQYSFLHPCGAPACALGWYMASKGRIKELKRELEQGTRSIYSDENSFAAKEFPGLNYHELIALFGEYGCDMAERDARAAANYIEDFIQRKLAEG